MIDDIRAAQQAALDRLAAATTLDDVTTLAGQLLGKRGDLTQLKTKLGALATVDEKKAAGQALNEATETVTAAGRGAPDRPRGRRARGCASRPSAST